MAITRNFACGRVRTFYLGFLPRTVEVCISNKYVQLTRTWDGFQQQSLPLGRLPFFTFGSRFQIPVSRVIRRINSVFHKICNSLQHATNRNKGTCSCRSTRNFGLQHWHIYNLCQRYLSKDKQPDTNGVTGQRLSSDELTRRMFTDTYDTK